MNDTIDNNKLGVEDFILGDKLASFIVFDLQWSPFKVGIIAYVFAIFLSLAISLIAGTLQSTALVVGLIDDYFYFLSETLLIPVIWAYYVWIITSPVSLYSMQAQEKGVERVKGCQSSPNLPLQYWLAW